MRVRIIVLAFMIGNASAMQSTHSVTHQSISKAILKNDAKQVVHLLQRTNASSATSSLTPQELQDLLVLAQTMENQALAATGSGSRAARIASGIALLGYGAASISLNFVYSLKCNGSTAPTALGTTLNSGSALAPLAGGLYLIYTGIANTSNQTTQAKATIVKHLVQSAAATRRLPQSTSNRLETI